jgi:glycosyltransferase involved in cell wall biosynthesis
MAPSNPPRLLVCCNSLAYFLNHRLAPALLARRHGFEVHVAASADTDPAAMSRLDLVFHPIALARHRLAPVSDLRAAFFLRRLVRALAPVVVHAITMKAALVTLTALPGNSGRRLIVTFPGLGRVFSDSPGAWPGLRKRIVVAVLRRYFRRHGRALATFENQADRDVFVDRGIVAPENTVMLRGTGIDLARFTPRPAGDRGPAEPTAVLFAGRLLRQKGAIAFLDAAKSYLGQAREKGWPPARFAIAGAPDPGNRDSIDRGRLDALSAASGVTLLGQVADMPALLRRTDLLCLPTRYGEGLPRILLEAAACAVPAVASDVAGCREIVVDGETGRLVPPGDPRALLEALRELIAAPSLRARMGRRARRRVEQGGFDEETIARAFLTLYRGD